MLRQHLAPLCRRHLRTDPLAAGGCAVSSKPRAVGQAVELPHHGAFGAPWF
jgi:hypothetical protein